MSEEIPEEEDVFGVPLDWQIPEDMIPRYATNFIVQGTGHEFVISFFEVRPPIVLGSREEQRAQLEKMGSVAARCIAQIVLSPSRMAELVSLLTRHYERLTLQISSENEEEE